MFKIDEQVSINKILTHLEKRDYIFEYTGPSNISFKRLSALDSATEGCISFLRPGYIKRVDFQGDLLIHAPSYLLSLNTKYARLITDNPALIACELSTLFKAGVTSGIHPSALVSSTARIGKNPTIGPFSIVGNNVHIGDDCIIGANVTIENSELGHRVKIWDGCKIGVDGYGSEFSDLHGWVHLKHNGSVRIGNDVSINANTVVFRATFDETTIEDGVVIGSICWVGHNVIIEKHAWIGHGVTIAGSCHLYERCKVWANASIREKVSVYPNSVIGMGSVVLKDVMEDQLVAGNPGRVINS